MANSVTREVWLSRLGLTSHEKLLLLRIADHINEGSGVAWPSMGSIAADCEFSNRGTIDVLRRLVDKGLVVVVADATGRRSRRYGIDLGRLSRRSEPRSPLPLATGDRSSEPGSPLGESVGVSPALVGVSPTTRSSEPGSPEPEEPDQPEERVSLRIGERQLVLAFDRFFRVYPKKEKRDEALLAWRKVVHSPELAAEIIAAVEARVTSDEWRRDGGRWIPQPVNYLRNRRWTDNIAAVAGGGQVTSTKPLRPGLTGAAEPGEYDGLERKRRSPRAG